MSTLSQLYKGPSDLIQPHHIAYIVGDGNYSIVYFIDGSKVMFGRTLKRYAEDHPSFIRISKALLANPSSITDWERKGANFLRIDVLGVQHWVSRRRVKELAEQLTEGLMNK